jgi:hypothetical protein
VTDRFGERAPSSGRRPMAALNPVTGVTTLGPGGRMRVAESRCPISALLRQPTTTKMPPEHRATAQCCSPARHRCGLCGRHRPTASSQISQLVADIRPSAANTGRTSVQVRQRHQYSQWQMSSSDDIARFVVAARPPIQQDLPGGVHCTHPFDHRRRASLVKWPTRRIASRGRLS